MSPATQRLATASGTKQPVEAISGDIPDDPKKDKQLAYALDLLHGSALFPPSSRFQMQSDLLTSKSCAGP